MLVNFPTNSISLISTVLHYYKMDPNPQFKNFKICLSFLNIDDCIFHQIAFCQGAAILDAIRQGWPFCMALQKMYSPQKWVHSIVLLGPKLRSTCFRSENCRKFSPANRRHHNWEPIHQSSMLRVTIDAIDQCG